MYVRNVAFYTTLSSCVKFVFCLIIAKPLLSKQLFINNCIRGETGLVPWGPCVQRKIDAEGPRARIGETCFTNNAESAAPEQ
jgi:hypothetical protein